jgi:TonB family protein
LFSVLIALPSARVVAQTPASQPKYPESAGGLEHLAKDIIKALKANDNRAADGLIRSLLLPDPNLWYKRVFGDKVASNEGVEYQTAGEQVPVQLKLFFMKMIDEHHSGVSATRFLKPCDNYSRLDTLAILHARQEQVPLYELRFSEGDRIMRLPYFAYVDGGFRFFTPPHIASFDPPIGASKPIRAVSDSATSASPSPPSTARPDRIKQGGNITAAKLINRVQPTYPEEARRSLIQGTVRIHAIIAKDGSVRSLEVISGTCILAEAAVDAVEKWRYAVTTLNGEPVEVDTTIDVIFTLNR